MAVRREMLILVGLFLALVLFIALGPGSAEDAPDRQATSHASGPRGTLALYRWLGALGYAVERLEYQAFALAPEDTLLFVLGPARGYSREEVDAVLAWVAAGGTLVLADDRPGNAGGAAALLRALDLRAERAAGPIDYAPALQPGLGAAGLRAETQAVIGGERADLAALAGSHAAPVLVGLQSGAGYVYLSSALHPFTNAGLRDAQSATAVLSLLRRARPGGRVLFDEIHHGFVREPSLRALLLGSPWGWAALYALLMGAAYLAATGRRFGRPVPLREEVARRSSAEYLESMAGLLRRGGKRAYLLAHYRAAFKRRLSRSLGMRPPADDDRFVAELTAARPVDAAALRALLAQMRRDDLGEAELLRLLAEADRFV